MTAPAASPSLAAVLALVDDAIHAAKRTEAAICIPLGPEAEENRREVEALTRAALDAELRRLCEDRERLDYLLIGGHSLIRYSHGVWTVGDISGREPRHVIDRAREPDCLAIRPLSDDAPDGLVRCHLTESHEGNHRGYLDADTVVEWAAARLTPEPAHHDG